MSFRSESEPGAQNPEIPITTAMKSVLGRVHVNMPWNLLPRFKGLVLDNGIHVELGFGAEDLEKTSIEEIVSTVGLLRSAGCRITVHGPFWDLCPGSIDPRIREVSGSRLHRLFEILEHVRPVQVVCHTGFDPRHHRGHRGVWIENSLWVWGPLVERAEALGAPLVLENVWEEDPELHLELLDRLRSPWVGFCLDTGHQNAFSKASLSAWLEATSGYLKEIHIHDNDGSFDHHLPVGRGNIDFDLLFRFLEANGLRPVLTLEPHREEDLFRSLESLAQMESFRKLLE